MELQRFKHQQKEKNSVTLEKNESAEENVKSQGNEEHLNKDNEHVNFRKRCSQENQC